MKEKYVEIYSCNPTLIFFLFLTLLCYKSNNIFINSNEVKLKKKKKHFLY